MKGNFQKFHQRTLIKVFVQMLFWQKSFELVRRTKVPKFSRGFYANEAHTQLHHSQARPTSHFRRYIRAAGRWMDRNKFWILCNDKWVTPRHLGFTCTPGLALSSERCTRVRVYVCARVCRRQRASQFGFSPNQHPCELIDQIIVSGNRCETRAGRCGNSRLALAAREI